jgi:hypothetical protein
MKRNGVFVAAMAALLLAFGLVLAGCDNGNDIEGTDPLPPLSGTGPVAKVYIHNQSNSEITVSFAAPTEAELEIAHSDISEGALAKPIAVVPDSVSIPAHNSTTYVSFSIPNEYGYYYYVKLSVGSESTVRRVGFRSAGGGTVVYQAPAVWFSDGHWSQQLVD